MFIVGIMFLLVPWLMAGCGISEEVYNAVVAERDVAQAEVTSLQSQLTTAQSDLATAQGDLATAQGDLTTAQGDLAEVQSDLAEAEAQVTELEEVIIARFVGVWLNEDPNTGGITRTEIKRDGDELAIHMWGACFPQDCDWGELRIDASEAGSGVLSITWDHGFAVETQEITLTFDDWLIVKTHTHYTDKSGRADRDSVYRFFRQ